MARPQPEYQVNRATSKRRADRLQSYLSEHVWDPFHVVISLGFGCKPGQATKGN